MQRPVRQLPVTFSDVLDRADASLVAGWYHAVSVQPERIRAWLRLRGLHFVDPARSDTPPLAEVDRTAEAVIERASSLLGALGGAAGLVGAATVPPEFLATNVGVLRLAQRLCVVYGFDPTTDRGEMALTRALAAAYGVDLPETGPARMRVRDLPSLLRGEGSGPQAMAGKVARAMAKSTAWWVAGRLTRFVPVLSAGTAPRRPQAGGGRLRPLNADRAAAAGKIPPGCPARWRRRSWSAAGEPARLPVRGPMH
ncbi:MAG: hypothetical protein R3F59_08040 [Myxococcota bacterium]